MTSESSPDITSTPKAVEDDAPGVTTSDDEGSVLLIPSIPRSLSLVC